MNTKKDPQSEAVSTDGLESTSTGEGLTRTEAEPTLDIHAIPTEAKAALPPGEITTTAARPPPGVKVTLAAEEPVLIDATISFHTLDDNKNEDTFLTVTVRQLDGTVSARISNDFGEFKNQSNVGPFNLVVLNNSPKSQLRSGNVTIRIDPVSDDTWHFNFFLSVGFSDRIPSIFRGGDGSKRSG